MLANEWEKVQPVLTFSDNVNIITMKNKEGILRGRVLRIFVVYPVYYKAGMAEEAILQMYQAIAPSMKSVLQCLICFNLPFTIVKGLIAVVICMLIYKPLSPVLKGRLSEY